MFMQGWSLCKYFLGLDPTCFAVSQKEPWHFHFPCWHRAPSDVRCCRWNWLAHQDSTQFHFSAHINEYHYREKTLILTLNLLNKRHQGFSAHCNAQLTIFRCPWKMIPMQRTSIFLKYFPGSHFLLLTVAGLRGSITTWKITSSLKQVISTVCSGEAHIQMSRRKSGNEATVLTSWKICVIQWYNKRTKFLKKLL